jgi:two-component system response regulator HydG
MSEPAPLDDRFRRALMDTVPCAVFVADAQGQITFWNRSAEELTGYAASEMLGGTCERLRIRESGETDNELVASVCRHAGEDESASECEIRCRDGRIVPVVRRARAVRDEAGARLGVIVALVDVSILKRARRQIEVLRREIDRAGQVGGLVGRSEPMRKLYEAVELVADTDASVVIEGETGTGKELVARTLHARSGRREGVFLAVNCGALTETLLDAELFGHVKGAFTGAVADRTGRFEEASGGTLFLDEVAELSPASQVKLLRVLQEGEITRVGESRPRPIDVRVIAATNRDLAALARAGSFREDLFYRLRVVALKVPALRDRREDIPDLVVHFIGRLNDKYGRQVRRCSPEAMELLTAFDWPGNVRQLEHALEHAFVVTAEQEAVLPAASLPPEVAADLRPAASTAAEAALAPARAPVDERTATLEALAAAGGNKAKAARLLGLTRAGLYKRLKRLGIT